jgi:hypothetical protein
MWRVVLTPSEPRFSGIPVFCVYITITQPAKLCRSPCLSVSLATCPVGASIPIPFWSLYLVVNEPLLAIVIASAVPNVADIA